MKKTLISFLFLSIFTITYAQENFSMEEGKVTQYEMSMTEYDKDSDAEALVIYDMGEYFFQGHDSRGFLLHMERKTKIKILKSAGIEYANIEIPYYIEGNDWEDVHEIKATTYNVENGQLIKTVLDNKNIYEEKATSNWKVKKMALPNVREGSVIEISYKIVTPYFVNMRQWNFQRKVPVVYSKIKYKAIPYYEYVYIAKGTDKFNEYNSKVLLNDIRYGNLQYKEMEHIFVMKDLPAFRDEEFITSEEDYLVSLNFQLSKIYYPTGGSREFMSTWPALCEEYLKDTDFGKYIKNAEKEGKKVLPSLGLENKTSLEQAQIITNYVKSNFNWNGIYGKHSEFKLSDFLKQKKGNVANINFFLTGLLRSANIEAYPIVLSTRKNGMIRKAYPFSKFFNYTVVQVIIDGQSYFIDATEPLLYFSDLPIRCINVEGLVVKPKSEEWVALTQKRMSFDQKEISLKIIPEENKIEANARFASQGYNSYNYRNIYLDKKENLVNYLKKSHNIDIIGDIDIDTNANRLEKPFLFSFSYMCPLESTPDKLFIHPFTNLSISDNPFKQTDRRLIIDMIYVRKNNYKSTIEIPQGYKIEYMPQIQTIDNPVIRMDYLIQNEDNKIIINATYSLKKNIYRANEYDDLKMSFAEIIKKMSELIILVKE